MLHNFELLFFKLLSFFLNQSGSSAERRLLQTCLAGVQEGKTVGKLCSLNYERTIEHEKEDMGLG